MTSQKRHHDLMAGHAVALLILFTAMGRGEDADRHRSYLHLRNGDIGPVVGVHDLWGLSLGMNFNRYWGLELSADFFERGVDHPSLGTVGEESIVALLPQMRLRYPVLRDRLVPYLVAGAGPAFMQFNDRKPAGFGHTIEADSVRLAVAAGAGLEYFIADNVAVGVEARYLWLEDRDVTTDGLRYSPDFSSTLLTFGLRVYLSENEPRRLAELDDPVPNRFYLGLRVGGSHLTDRHWTSDVTLEPEASAAWGWLNQIGGLSVGANFGLHWGVELAMDLNEYTMDVEGLGQIGEYSIHRFLPQLRLRWPLNRGRFVPYFLMGAGATFTEFNDRKPDGEGVAVETDPWNPAVTVGVGAEYFLTRNFSFNADVRWLHTWGHSLRLNDGPEATGGFSDVQFFAGFRVYLFGF